MEVGVLLDVGHLEMMDAIDREGTVTGAARRLHLTQPAVSHRLKALETRLGIELFRREAGRMALTQEGSRLLASARAVLEELERVEHDLGQMRAGYQGVLRITTECYTCYHWLPTILRRFRERFPRVDLQIVPEATHTPIETMLEKRLDLAIVHNPVVASGVVARELFADELVAIVPPEHELAERQHLEADDFAGLTLILHSRPEESVLIRELLRPAGVEPARVLELQLTEAVVETVKAGLGVSVVARWTIARDLAAGSLVGVPITEGGLHRTWYAAMPEARAGAPALTALVELLERDALAAVSSCGVAVDSSL